MTGTELRTELAKKHPMVRFIDGHDDALIGLYFDPTTEAAHPVYCWEDMVAYYEVKHDLMPGRGVPFMAKFRATIASKMTGPGRPLVVSLLRYHRQQYGPHILDISKSLQHCTESKWFSRLSLRDQRQLLQVVADVRDAINTDAAKEDRVPGFYDGLDPST